MPRRGNSSRLNFPGHRTGKIQPGRIVVAVVDGRGRTITAGGLARWVRAVAPPRARGELAIAVVPDAQVKKLNREYRGISTPTDVLSFPAATPGVLGDIVIARGVAQTQAREHGHPLSTELRILALHGLLHLIGYDHDDVNDKGRMRRIEERLRRQGGLPTGLTARARTR